MVKDLKLLWLEIKESQIREKGIIQYWEDKCEYDLYHAENLERSAGGFGLTHWRNSRAARELYEPVYGKWPRSSIG